MIVTEKGLMALKDPNTPPRLVLMIELSIRTPYASDEECSDLYDQLLEACGGDFEKSIQALRSGVVKITGGPELS